jgi:hypothetical protein
MRFIVPYHDTDEVKQEDHDIVGVSKHNTFHVQVSRISTGCRDSTLATPNT